MWMPRIHELSAFGNQTIVIRSLFAVHDGVFPFSDFRFAHATHSNAMGNFKQRRNARCVVVGTFVVRSRFVQNAKHQRDSRKNHRDNHQHRENRR